MAPVIEKATATMKPGRGKNRPEQSSGSAATSFSKFSEEEKARYRKWAKAPTARRISDAKVKIREEAGKP